MSKVEEFLMKYNPEGVDNIPLWELTAWDKKFNAVDKSMQKKVIKYKYYLAKDLDALVDDTGDIRILYTNEKVAYTSEEKCKGNICEGEIVAIPWGGTPTVKYYNGKFVTGDNRIATSLDTKILNNKYLFYWMISQLGTIADFYRGAGIQHPSMSSVLSMEIPLPHIKVQEEIVKILDSFTNLIDALNEELSLRQKQFEYYRDQLYDDLFKKTKGVDVLCFSELGKIERGKRFVRDDIKTHGQPCIHYGDIYTFYGVKSNKAKTYLDRDFPQKMRYADIGDVIIVGAGENNWDIGVGLAWLGEEPAAVHDACYIVKHNNNPLFIAYYTRTTEYHQQLKKCVSEGKICSFSAEGLGKVTIPIPSLVIQQSIVEKLDAFESIISSLKEEIALRQKQYEYYRDKLLTFD